MVFRCNSAGQALCTGCCVLSVLLLAVGTIMCHVAMGTLLTPLKNLRSNLQIGMDTIINTDQLTAQSQVVKTNAQSALALCGIPNAATGCAAASTTDLTTANSTSQLNAISTAFDVSLSQINKVVHDKYLGIAKFATSATQLETIQANLTTMQNYTQPIQCGGTNAIYCSMHSSADTLLTQVSTVKTGINDIVNADFFVKYDENKGRVDSLHALPYLSWLGLLFYLCFFVSKNATSPCRGGKAPACCACTCHGLFWFLFWIIAVVIVAVGVVLTSSDTMDRLKIENVFAEPVTPKVIIDHVEVYFPGFYNTVMRDMIDGLEKLYKAFLVLLVAHMCLLMHTLSACICGVYIEKDADKDYEP